MTLDHYDTDDKMLEHDVLINNFSNTDPFSTQIKSRWVRFNDPAFLNPYRYITTFYLMPITRKPKFDMPLIAFLRFEFDLNSSNTHGLIRRRIEQKISTHILPC
jgi:hypothetical protein